MRARSMALVLIGFLASTSAVGIVVWGSKQGGSDQVFPGLDAPSQVNAVDSATGDAFSVASFGTSEAGFLNAVQASASTQGVDPFPASDFIRPATMSAFDMGLTQPLSVDMGLMHLQGGGAAGTGATSLGSMRPLYATAMSGSLPAQWGGGGGSGGAGKGGNPESDGGEPGSNAGNPGSNGGDNSVDEPPSVDEPGSDPSSPPSEPDVTSPEPDDGLPMDPVDPSVPTNPPATSVPEPGTLGLLAVGVVGLLLGRRKRRAPVKA